MITDSELKDFILTHRGSLPAEMVHGKDFYLQKAVDYWQRWKEYDIESGLLDKLLSLNYYRSYDEFTQLADSDKQVNDIRNLLFMLIAHCNAPFVLVVAVGVIDNLTATEIYSL